MCRGSGLEGGSKGEASGLPAFPYLLSIQCDQMGQALAAMDCLPQLTNSKSNFEAKNPPLSKLFSSGT